MPQDRGVCSWSLSIIPPHCHSQCWQCRCLPYSVSVFLAVLFLFYLWLFGSCSVTSSSSGEIVLLIGVTWCVSRRRWFQGLSTLLLNRNSWNILCIWQLYHIHLLVSSVVIVFFFLMDSCGFLYIRCHLQTDCFVFQLGWPLSCLIALVSTTSIVLNRSGENGHPCLVPDF